MEQVRVVTEDNIVFKRKRDGTADLYLGTRNDCSLLDIPQQCRGHRAAGVNIREFTTGERDVFGRKDCE